MKRQILRETILAMSASKLIPHRLRPGILRLAGVQVGNKTLILNGTSIRGSASVSIGDGVFVNQECFFDAEALIVIERDVQIGDHVRLITSSHSLGPSARRAGPSVSHEVVIKSGCWIGSGAAILPGVSVARGCIIAAGAVVTSSTSPDGLYAGVPAKRIRDLDA